VIHNLLLDGVADLRRRCNRRRVATVNEPIYTHATATNATSTIVSPRACPAASAMMG
jgi:hypothetical protein